MAEQEKDPLFPVLPEDLKSLSDAEVQKLLDDSVAAAALIDADDEEFLAGLTASARPVRAVDSAALLGGSAAPS